MTAARRAPWRETINIEWTDEKPTARGDYWLSIDPCKRGLGGREGFPAVIACVVDMCANYLFYEVDLNSQGFSLGVQYAKGGCLLKLSEPWFEGARWAKRTDPADPHPRELCS